MQSPRSPPHPIPEIPTHNALGVTINRRDPRPSMFEKVQIRGVDFEGGSLQNACLFNCRIEDCVLDKCALDGLSAFGTRWSQCTFRRATFHDAQLSVASECTEPGFFDCDFTGARMNVYIGEGFFQRCRFLGVRMKDVNTGGGVFKDCLFGGEFRGCEFRARGEDSHTRGWLHENFMSGCDFTNASLYECNFFGIRMNASQLPSMGHLVIENWYQWIPLALQSLAGRTDRLHRQVREGLETFREFREGRNIYTAVFSDKQLPFYVGNEGVAILHELANSVRATPPRA